MSKTNTQLNQFTSAPATWLSEGRLKLSLLLRQETLSEPQNVERAHAILALLLQEETSRKRTGTRDKQTETTSKDIIARASDDYLRCILAKSVAEVYSKITPKYRNEAARKQFFKRLLQITEAAHLTQSSSNVHEVLFPEMPDDVLHAVNAELKHHIANKVDLSSEYSAKLSLAKQEFRSFLKHHENLIGLSWLESERFQKNLSISSFFPPTLVENENTWRWGSQWYPEEGILNINPPMLFFDVLRRGILAREAAILLSPKNLDTMAAAPRVLCEQAEYFAYTSMERKNDKDLWAEARHGLRKSTRFRAHELIDFFQFYEMMVGDSLYRDVWARLKEFGNVRLTVSDYYIVFNTLAARPGNPKFNKSEMKLLQLLSKRPNVAAGEAGRLLSVSIPTAMKAIRDLTQKAGLRSTIIVDMLKIGLLENLALISTSKHADVIGILSRFPYCRQVFRTYGSFDLFCVMDIPIGYLQFARQFLNRMQDRGLVSGFRLLEMRRDLQSINFDHYDISKGRWDIHWDSWGISLREGLSKGESFAREYSTSAPAHDLQLDRLDLNVLSSMQLNCRTPFSAIARTLGVSGAYVGKKVNRLLQEGVFNFAIWPLKIGSEDWGIVALSCSKETAMTVAHYVRWMPAWRGGFVTGDFEGLLAIVWCPSGELKQFFKAVDDRLVRTGSAQVECLNSIGEWVVARWLPVDPDDPWRLFSEDGRWIFDEQRYMALIP
jgi:DNA-binding Lrp family transcriptional regulator